MIMENLQSISARPVADAGASFEKSGKSGFRLPGLGDYGKKQADNEARFQGDSLNLSPEAEAQLRKLRQRDAEVRAHEQAHIAAAGQYAASGPHYEYQQGPDGRQYAIGGHVDIDVSEIEGDPEASKKKARQVRRAALAPGEPSGKDMAVAARAANMETSARLEEKEEETDSGTEKNAQLEGAGKSGQPVEAEKAPSSLSRAGSFLMRKASEIYDEMSQLGVMPQTLASEGAALSIFV